MIVDELPSFFKSLDIFELSSDRRCCPEVWPKSKKMKDQGSIVQSIARNTLIGNILESTKARVYIKVRVVNSDTVPVLRLLA
jgi:hypothetical protein